MKAIMHTICLSTHTHSCMQLHNVQSYHLHAYLYRTFPLILILTCLHIHFTTRVFSWLHLTYTFTCKRIWLHLGTNTSFHTFMYIYLILSFLPTYVLTHAITLVHTHIYALILYLHLFMHIYIFKDNYKLIFIYLIKILYN